MGNVVVALAEHAFEHLFIECLGWDRLRGTTVFTQKEVTLHLTTVAQKRGFTVFHCPAHRTVLANRPLLRDVQRQIRRSHHEHILIYSCETPRKQVWQWATAFAGGRRILHREHPFFSCDPPKRMVERIEGLTVAFQEEEQTTLPDVLHRVRIALLPDSELNLFAKYPSYAAESDRLAMAMKRGEPGSQHAFVQFHMPLARHSSKKLVRWFNMDPEDAEQTAMIGLMEAARRFDPDRGFQFSTYASYWIRNACQRYGLEWGLPLHVPTHFFWACYKLEFIEAELLATYGFSAAQERFEEELRDAGVTQAQWRHFCAARHVVHFSEIDKRERAKLDRPERSELMVEDNEHLRRCIQKAMRTLRPRHVQILKLRYGFEQPSMSLQEIGDLLGLTKERIRQLQCSAEKKLIEVLQASNRNGELVEW